MFEKLYYYRAKVVSVYDGDTCRLDIDLGMHVWQHNESIRLNRINAPEVRGPERERGLAARDFLRGLIAEKEVFLQTVRDKKGKYGRFLGEIWLQDGDGWKNVNDALVQAGHAVYKSY